jgi:hypothetical protein
LRLLALCLEQDAASSPASTFANEFISWAQLISMPLAVSETLASNLGAGSPWALRPLLMGLSVVDPDEIRGLLGETAFVVVLGMSIV